MKSNKWFLSCKPTNRIAFHSQESDLFTPNRFDLLLIIQHSIHGQTGSPAIYIENIPAYFLLSIDNVYEDDPLTMPFL